MADAPDTDPPRPPPARPAPARAEPRAPASAKRDTRPRPPTPVRETVEAAASEAEGPEPDVESAALVADGETWTVRVAGRARSGSPRSPTPMLLLRFAPDRGDAGGVREALVVGRRLADLTEARLATALRTARPPRSGDPPELFPEAQERRRRR